ncbi:hypothetical protein Hanom_Chr04g00369271 [Helianthus anomalus]
MNSYILNIKQTFFKLYHHNILHRCFPHLCLQTIKNDVSFLKFTVQHVYMLL